jgi:SAM-dependent methyltransferase
LGAREGDTDQEAFKAFQAAGWTKQAAGYGGLIGAMTARLAEPLLDAAAVEHGARVLDVATGPGYVAERAEARGARPTGIDISEAMLERARAHHPEIGFMYGDAEDLPFESQSFDAVLGGFVLNVLPRPERALSEAERVLVSGGGVAFSIWDRPERMRVIGVVSEAMEEVGVPSSAVPPGPDPYRFADDDEFSALLAAAGFGEIAVETVGLEHRVPGSDELWEGFLSSSVRASTRLEAAAPEVRAEVRRAVERNVAPYRTNAGLTFPIVAKIASGRKPR